MGKKHDSKPVKCYLAASFYSLSTSYMQKNNQKGLDTHLKYWAAQYMPAWQYHSLYIVSKVAVDLCQVTLYTQNTTIYTGGLVLKLNFYILFGTHWDEQLSSLKNTSYLQNLNKWEKGSLDYRLCGSSAIWLSSRQV